MYSVIHVADPQVILPPPLGIFFLLSHSSQVKLKIEILISEIKILIEFLIEILIEILGNKEGFI